jgi:predicted adenine nucleotide alpha hydrolase (AANH) superfamily ATPase
VLKSLKNFKNKKNIILIYFYKNNILKNNIYEHTKNAQKLIAFMADKEVKNT